jgi:hypothetical protein
MARIRKESACRQTGPGVPAGAANPASWELRKSHVGDRDIYRRAPGSAPDVDAILPEKLRNEASLLPRIGESP